eukprot:TRINITY_DN29507_c0_g1_i4.p1 TRINITY_DN29507_c0_g1~~TRINITY_DN29507_c0_g1_i4.p1  ORF type:complete len:454 (+),score=51.81 TRINITY_DN29507_c0_g1_i4:186-1547(+)
MAFRYNDVEPAVTYADTWFWLGWVYVGLALLSQWNVYIKTAGAVQDKVGQFDKAVREKFRKCAGLPSAQPEEDEAAANGTATEEVQSTWQVSVQMRRGLSAAVQALVFVTVYQEASEHDLDVYHIKSQSGFGYAGYEDLAEPDKTGCYSFKLPQADQYSACRDVQTSWEASSDESRLLRKWRDNNCSQNELALVEGIIEDTIWITEDGQVVECEKTEHLAIVGLALKAASLLASADLGARLDVLSTACMAIPSAIMIEGGCLKFDDTFNIHTFMNSISHFDLLDQMLFGLTHFFGKLLQRTLEMDAVLVAKAEMLVVTAGTKGMAWVRLQVSNYLHFITTREWPDEAKDAQQHQQAKEMSGNGERDTAKSVTGDETKHDVDMDNKSRHAESQGRRLDGENLFLVFWFIFYIVMAIVMIVLTVIITPLLFLCLTGCVIFAAAFATTGPNRSNIR